MRTIHVSNLEKISRGMTKSTKAAAAVAILQFAMQSISHGYALYDL